MINIKRFFKPESYITFLVFSTLIMSLQYAPGSLLVPFPAIIQFIFVCILGVIACGVGITHPRIFRLSVWQVVAGSFLFLFFVWSIITSVGAGKYVDDSARRAFLALGTSFLIFSSILVIQPSMKLTWRLASVFINISSFISLLGLSISFFGGSYIDLGDGTHLQTLSFFDFYLAQTVHMAGGFPRISSITVNPNTLGFFSGLACLISMVLYFSNRCSLGRFFILFPINFFALLHCLSRGSILAFTLSACFALFLYNKKKFFLVFLGGVVILVTLSPLYIDTVLELIEARAGQGLQGRGLIWLNALDVFTQHPIMGVGFGLEKELIHEPAGITWTMHNGYLVVLSETGLVGFFLMLSFLLVLLVSVLSGVASSKDKEKRAVLTLIFSVILFVLSRSMVETSIFRFTSVNVIFIVFSTLGVLFSGDNYGKKRC